jgi:hypothetical protein
MDPVALLREALDPELVRMGQIAQNQPSWPAISASSRRPWKTASRSRRYSRIASDETAEDPGF